MEQEDIFPTATLTCRPSMKHVAWGVLDETSFNPVGYVEVGIREDKVDYYAWATIHAADTPALHGTILL